MRTFEKLVNAVGGIDINLPRAVDGRTVEDMNSRLLFKAGQHHLDGPRSLMLARIRIRRYVCPGREPEPCPVCSCGTN